MLKIVIAFCISASVLLGIDEISTITDIRAEYASVKNILKSLDKDSYELPDISLEGAMAEIYRERDGDIVFSKTMINSEMWKSVGEYYFHNGKLFFIYESTMEYNEPIYSENFDLKKSKTEWNRYYFIDDKMVRWLDNDKKEVKKDSKSFLEKEKFLGDLGSQLSNLRKSNK